jgi:hypothetical protein
MLPRRWAVECFFAWINRNRRLAKDFEDTASATAFLYIASILKMTGHISMLDSWAPQGSGGLLDWRHLVQHDWQDKSERSADRGEGVAWSSANVRPVRPPSCLDRLDHR